MDPSAGEVSSSEDQSEIYEEVQLPPNESLLLQNLMLLKSLCRDARSRAIANIDNNHDLPLPLLANGDPAMGVNTALPSSSGAKLLEPNATPRQHDMHRSDHLYLFDSLGQCLQKRFEEPPSTQPLSQTKPVPQPSAQPQS